jgi:hypothetical protein
LTLVIDLKHEHWNGNDVQYQYMRPETLFGPKNLRVICKAGSAGTRKAVHRVKAGVKNMTMKFGPVDTKIPERVQRMIESKYCRAG